MTETPREAMEEMYGSDLPQCDICGGELLSDGVDFCHYVDPGYMCDECLEEMIPIVTERARIDVEQEFRNVSTV